MPETITATTAARNFRELLDAIEHRGETFRVKRFGRPVAELGPTRSGGARTRWRDVLAALREGPRPDADFAADLAAIRASVGHLPPDPWAPSSTPRS